VVLKLYNYDRAEALKSDEAIEVFMADAFEAGDARYIAKALGVVARAKGMTKIARRTGLAREQLYRTLSENGNPTLATIFGGNEGDQVRGDSQAACHPVMGPVPIRDAQLWGISDYFE
jgi:probable addiction module antidote protein